VVVGGRRLRLVADVHEDYVALLRDRPWARGLSGWVARAVARAGEVLAGCADLTVVADSHLAPKATRRLVVRNLADPSMLPSAAGPDQSAGLSGPGAEPRPRALYVGDLRASRGLFAMLDAAVAAPNWSFDLVGPVSASDQARLDDRLSADRALAARVQFPGRLAPARAWNRATGAWAGLALLENTAAFRDSMPSKIREYLACGLPVLTTPLPRPAALIRQTGAGAIVTSPAEAAAVLENWFRDRFAYAAVQAAALAAAADIRSDCGDMDVFAARLKRLAR
jgi:glycosyltransferase involved in cell wall biosynthesis